MPDTSRMGGAARPAEAVRIAGGRPAVAPQPVDRGGAARRTVNLSTLLLRINRAAVTVAIGIVFLAVVVGSFAVGMMDLADTAHVQARVLADNATTAMLFQDKRAAVEVLGVLRHSPHVQAAELFTPDGRSFARYVRPRNPESRGPFSWTEDASGLPPFFLHVREEFGNADGRVGTLYLTVSLGSIFRQTAWIGLLTLVAAAVSLGVSSLLMGHLDRAVLGPLKSLNDLMARARGHSDFSVRARASHIAEIDALGRGFNEMIQKVQDRDRQLAQRAFFDVLTGLPNRSAFLDLLEREVQRAARNGNRLGLLFLDLDGFKQVNDTMGHEAGDRLLVEAAERIREALRPSDATARVSGPANSAHPARLGGDEFTVLLPDLHEAGDALVVARRIGDIMRRPFVFDGRELAITTSIGAAVFPEDGRDAPTLLQRADIAMYHAKRSGRDNSLLFSAIPAEQSTSA